MATEKISNSNIYANAYISEDWGSGPGSDSGYKLEVDLSSDLVTPDWMLNFNLDLSYNIRKVFGVDLIDNGSGNYTISGQGDWQDLEPEETAKATFIIDTDGQDAIIPQFNSLDSQAEMPERAAMSDQQLDISPTVTEDWKGGYKVEVDITSEFNVEDWTLEFQMPHSIRKVFGVDLIDNSNGNYTISGQGDWQDLEPGEVAKATFIIDDKDYKPTKDHKATLPQFNTIDSVVAEEPIVENTPGDNTLMGSVISDSDPQPTPKPSQLSSNAISVGFEKHANGTTYTTSAQRQDWDAAWSTQMDQYATISNEEAHSGNNSLKMTYPANAQSNAGAKWQVPSQQEYYLSYWVKFDNDFDFDGPRLSGGKLPGLGAGDLASGGNKPNGNNGFTSRYMWREDGKAVLYLYHMDQEGTYGDDILLKGNDGSDKYFERGQWHNMVQRVKVNDGSQSNGEIDVWMDNEQVLDLDNLRFMTNNQGIDTTFFSTFHGGYGSDWWPEKNDNAYFDDFVVSTNAADVGL
ncbi:MAG: polysaccharide lyase [Waterburya sp.]